jgi:hypothetical protein
MLRAVLPALALFFTGCAPDLEGIIQEIQDAPLLSTGPSSGPDTATPTSTDDSGGVWSSSHGGGGTTTAGSTEDDSPDTGGVGSTGQSGASSSASDGAGDEVLLPEVVAIELPAVVHAAGPVPITVQTNAASVRVKLDGVDVGELVDAGGELFVGELAVKGAISNGTRQVEVLATLGEHEASKGASFEVKVPEAGKPAWAKPGPLGSRTNRIALTPGGDVIEAGLRIGASIPRPSIHKRSGLNGTDLWGKKVLLSELEGHVADLAIAPDGGIWVAMNVKEVDQKWRPHILLLAPDGSPTGVDEPGALGSTLRAIAADEEGGCFGVGFAVVEGGDLDVVYQGVNAAHQGTVTDPWDYQPPKAPAHSFADAAMDVVIDGDVAWVAGLSVGPHDGKAIRTRGMIVPIDIHTGTVVGPVIIAPASELWKESMFFGLALDLDGVVVTGAGCQDGCGGVQRIETSRYTLAGVRTWHQPEAPAEGAYGSDVVVDSQGRAIVAGASQQGGVLRGQAFARTIGKVELWPLWAHWFPFSKESSEALGAARDEYDRIFIGGYITAGGSPQTWIVQVSP